MKAISQNPATEEIIAEHEFESVDSAIEKIQIMRETFKKFRRTKIEERCQIIKKLGEYLEREKLHLAQLITNEMGKPLAQAISEIEKCKLACDYFAENSPKFLQPEKVEIQEFESYIEFDPIGVVLAIMPWNFPFWQVIRCAVPAILVGNVVVLKHSPNTFLCAKEIERILNACYDYPVLRNIFVVEKDIGRIIEIVDGVSLTGSTRAGKSVGEIAGRNIKPVVLELGGSDPFIVFKDADIEKAVELAVRGRIINSGQSCIASKRFIIHEDIYEDFKRGVEKRIKELKIGNPMENVDLGPIARKDLFENALRIVRESASAGAKISGGRRLKDVGFFFEPALIEAEKTDIPCFSEETFAPIMPMVKFRTDEEAIELANKTEYGLGAVIFTKNIEKAKEIARYIEAGNIGINQLVRSHPALPFGGVKKSGIGRELSRYGMLEFANIKTVCIQVAKA